MAAIASGVRGHDIYVEACGIGKHRGRLAKYFLFGFEAAGGKVPLEVRAADSDITQEGTNDDGNAKAYDD